ncbi:MAG: histidine phosphatase family protein [Desulfovibrio sp.]
MSSVQYALLRHGKTEWNVEKRVQGWLDSPLSPEGVERYEKFALQMPKFGFDGILCSDLGRAVATATILNQSVRLPIVQDGRLREQCFGRLEGLVCSEDDYAVLKKARDIHSDSERVEGMESFDTVQQRATAALCEHAQNYAGQKILVVTHHRLIVSLVTHLWGRLDFANQNVQLKSRQLQWLRSSSGCLGIETINSKFKILSG